MEIELGECGNAAVCVSRPLIRQPFYANEDASALWRPDPKTITNELCQCQHIQKNSIKIANLFRISSIHYNHFSYFVWNHWIIAMIAIIAIIFLLLNWHNGGCWGVPLIDWLSRSFAYFSQCITHVVDSIDGHLNQHLLLPLHVGQQLICIQSSSSPQFQLIPNFWNHFAYH